ncbi:dihydroxyacetone kinase phosphoryl donor subunit DhaM [Rubrobacter taiwanensis]|uniref:dihydroxyacetone kinase phosphoryl donor subunit DhaM n=1 Tax=Rubrobacter taiwanensis TaxID=185139 RepID=UPI001A9CBFCB|nr:dihydroxyacetone kinase phosphoryl donor subunit DhaM [Rubrobacter taiwanensis]
MSLVLVSHSRKIAEGTAELVRQMAGEELKISAIGGDPEGGLGTDPDEIRRVLEDSGGEDVLVFMDLGSAVMSAEAVREELKPELRGRVHLVDAPFVEGAFSAGVAASAGSSVEECIEAAAEARTESKLH